MADPVFIPTSTNGVLRVLDGTAVRLAHTSAFGRGDVKISGLQKILNESAWMEGRGQLQGYGLGARKYPSGSMSAWLPKLVNATDGSIQDMIMATGLYAARVSTLSTAGNGKIPVTLDLHIHWEGTDAGATDSDLYFADCEILIDSLEESDTGTFISFSWTCRGKVYNGNSRAATEYAAQAA